MQDPKKKIVTVKNVPPELLNAARKKAASQDRNLSQIIRDLLRQWVGQEKTPTTK